MSNIGWTDARARVELVASGDVMSDGQKVTAPGALVIKGEHVLVIEGDLAGLQGFARRASRCVQPWRHANLEREVSRARQASSYDSKQVEIERLKEALDVALTIIGREDLR